MANPLHEAIASAFEDELQKLAAEKMAMSPNSMKALGLLGVGAVGAETLHRAERDRRMGRAIRLQQNGY